MFRFTAMRRMAIAAASFACLAAGSAQNGKPARFNSELAETIERYTADRVSLSRHYYGLDSSAARRARFKKFYAEWLARLRALDFDSLSQDGKIDYLAFSNHLAREERRLELDAAEAAETEPLLPFAPAILELEENRRTMKLAEGRESAALLTKLARDVQEMQKKVEAALKKDSPEGSLKVTPPIANRAAGAADELRVALRNWFNFYNGYNPLVTWWVEAPHKELDKALEGYARLLAERAGGRRPSDRAATAEPAGRERGGNQAAPGERGAWGRMSARRPRDPMAIGEPIGREKLLIELAHEMIPYTPEELLDIAEKEYAWCETEMKRASRQLGYGDDWKKALEHVKKIHAEPGKQPEIIRKLALEAIEFVTSRNLVTVPELARETFRMEMMSPERQLVNPFFTGGEVISISFPTNTMTHEQKLMSMRGNNIPFSHATVFHELIPGHHLQGFMAARYRPYRSVFSTPFLGEGWALYWEMVLWDLGFHATPEERIGALFWRMHRCARIVFSLGFHLGKMTAEECINYLVDRVGHERDNAAAEVRRSFNGSYPPLYQAAYMIGGLQMRSLERELVGSGAMTHREFHDAVLRENRIPIELIRASLTRQKLTRDFKPSWKFYAAAPAPR